VITVHCLLNRMAIRLIPFLFNLLIINGYLAFLWVSIHQKVPQKSERYTQRGHKAGFL